MRENPATTRGAEFFIQFNTLTLNEEDRRQKSGFWLLILECMGTLVLIWAYLKKKEDARLAKEAPLWLGLQLWSIHGQATRHEE